MISLSVFLTSIYVSTVSTLNYDSIVNDGVDLQALCEECDTSTGSGYSAHPGYCHLFVHCTLGARGVLAGQVKECTRGLLWSQAVKQCVWPADSDCPNNPCTNPGLSFRDVRSCNGHFTCPTGGALEYRCCPRGMAYSAAQGACFLDSACSDPCLPGSANVTAQPPVCSRFAVEGAPHRYLWEVSGGNISMACATGTAFSQDACSCTTVELQDTSGTCKPYFYFPFDDNLLDAAGNTASGGSAVVNTREKAAAFSGGSKVVAWAMNNMELRSNFTLTFRFKASLPDGPGGTSQRFALVDNSDCEKEATFGVALLRVSHTRGTVHGGFRLKNGEAFTASTGTLNLGVWHEVTLLKQGARAELHVDKKIHPIEGQGMEADIARVDCAMTIGTGTGLHPFHGLIDEVKYYKCVPDELAQRRSTHRKRT